MYNLYKSQMFNVLCVFLLKCLLKGFSVSELLTWRWSVLAVNGKEQCVSCGLLEVSQRLKVYSEAAYQPAQISDKS